MLRDDRVYLDDMITCCSRAASYIEGMTPEQFLEDQRTIDAVVRNLEIVGEASKKIADQTKERYSDVEWKGIAGFRDIAIHAYSTIDMMTEWDIAQSHAPQLKTQLENILAELDAEAED